MNEFLLIFEYVDENIFHCINRLKNHLDITCQGKYKLHVGFNTKENGLAQMYHLLGSPALINLKNDRIIYGNFEKRDFIKLLLASSES